jgi:peptidoglycan/xylan/chitin deacetylase (PgdA/CDA1 family)
MKNKKHVWLLGIIILILIVYILNLKLKYQLDSHYTYEKLLSEKASLEAFQFMWPENKKMAMSITFDDSRLSQIKYGIPILDKYDIKGTFYVLLDSIMLNLHEWQQATKSGHEIGNHTINHPCSTNYNWIRKNSLEYYTLTRMFNELNNGNEAIKKLFGFYPKSFAYPCGQTFIGMGENTKSYVPLVAKTFESGRLYGGGTVHPVYCDMAKLPSVKMDNTEFEDIKRYIEQAKQTGKWLILIGHDVGNGINPQTTYAQTLEEICKYASDPKNEIWINNMDLIGSYIEEQRGEKPFKHISHYKNPTSSIYGKLWSVFYIWKMKYTHLVYSMKQEKS